MGGDDAAREAAALCDTWRDSDSGCALSRDRTLMVYATDGTAARLTEPQLRAVLARSAELEAENTRIREELEQRHQERPGRAYLANAYANGWIDAIAAYRTPGWTEREAGWRKFLSEMEADVAPQQPAPAACDHGPEYQCASCVPDDGSFTFEPLGGGQ